MTPVQILGTLFQLSGAVLAVAWLLWVSHVQNGQLAQLGGDAIQRLTNMLNVIANAPPPTTHVAGMAAVTDNSQRHRQDFQ